MKLLSELLPHIPSWYQQLLIAYQCEIYVTCSKPIPNFYYAATSRYDSYIAKPLYKSEVMRDELTITALLHPQKRNFYLLLCCRVTQLVLGELKWSREADHSNIIEVHTVASLRAITTNMWLPHTLGSSLGALMFSGLTVLLEQLNFKPIHLKLSSSTAAAGFYEKIGMIMTSMNDELIFEHKGSILPDEKYYQKYQEELAKIQSANAFKFTIRAQRLYHHKKILHYCQTLNTLFTQLKEASAQVLKSSSTYADIMNFLGYLFHHDEVPPCIQNGEYLYNTFIRGKFEHNPFFQSEMKKMLIRGKI